MSHTVVIGAGISGMACVRHLAGQEPLVLMDTREHPPVADADLNLIAGLQCYFGSLPADVIETAARIVLSPGLGRDIPELDSCERLGIPVIGELDLFAQAARGQVVAITGTNGKSTVTVMAAHILRSIGYEVAAGGNLGVPALDLLDDKVEVYVLELSSFQLERSGRFKADAACVLNVADDHLDRYTDFAHYARTKRNIYERAGAVVFNRDDQETCPGNDSTDNVSFGIGAPQGDHYGLISRADPASDSNRENTWLARGEECLLDVGDLPVRGQHNYLNALAAVALAERVGADPHLAARALGNFEGLPHRCELVALRNGVEAINDSKATNPGACIAALRGLDPNATHRIVLIAGGRGKGFDYECLREPVADCVRAAILIGEESAALAAVLADVTQISEAEDLHAATAAAFEIAKPGECVLLSPACASFDQFSNFEERGDVFREAANCLSK